MEKRMEDSPQWAVLVGLTIILAGIAAFLVMNRAEVQPGHEPPQSEVMH